MKVIINGLQIVLGAGDDPIRHGRSADTDSKKFKSLLLPVQRKRVCIFFIHDMCTREAEAYPPGISAGLPSSFMNCGSSVSLHAGHP